MTRSGRIAVAGMVLSSIFLLTAFGQQPWSHLVYDLSDPVELRAFTTGTARARTVSGVALPSASIVRGDLLNSDAALGEEVSPDRWYAVLAGGGYSDIVAENLIRLTQTLKDHFDSEVVRVDLQISEDFAEAALHPWSSLHVRSTSTDADRFSVSYSVRGNYVIRRLEIDTLPYIRAFRTLGPIPAMEPLTEYSVVLVPERRLTEIFSGSVADVITTRSLGRGELIKVDDVQLRVLVSAGDSIDVVLRRGTIEITIHGWSIGSGGMGETVPIQVELSGARFDARVIGWKEAYVDLT